MDLVIQRLWVRAPGRAVFVSLIPWARNFTLLAPWSDSHVKPWVPCTNRLLHGVCMLCKYLYHWLIGCENLSKISCVRGPAFSSEGGGSQKSEETRHFFSWPPYPRTENLMTPLSTQPIILWPPPQHVEGIRINLMKFDIEYCRGGNSLFWQFLHS